MYIEKKVQEETLAIRWHGRGGQGVVTAGKLLAAAALEANLYFQAFPDYGPERMGAPVRAYTRLSSKPIYDHSQIAHPDLVCVLDPTLLDVVAVTDGMGPQGILLVNTTAAPAHVRARAGWPDGRLFIVDASAIANRHLGRNVTNTPMLGALVAVLGLLSVEQFVTPLRDAFGEKFGEKSVQANLAAMHEAAQTVREAVAGPAAAAGGARSGERLRHWQEIPPGGLILEPGNAAAYHTGTWRSLRPQFERDGCNDCLFCWLYCPDGSIVVDAGTVLGIDYDHCKGCGICAAVCPRGVIIMESEEATALEEGAR